MTYCIPHGNRVGSAPGGEFICGPCEDGEPPIEGDGVALTEYRCSGCHILSGDNETGSYNNEHLDKAQGKMVKCDANGTPVVTPDAEDSN